MARLAAAARGGVIVYPHATIALGAVFALVAATLVASLIGRAGFPVPAADKRIGCIDGLRGYLALAVLLHHFIIWMQVTRLGGAWAAPAVPLYNQFGAGGVGLFFMTTGLVFYPRIRSGWRATKWTGVYIGRVARIVPLVAVSVAIIMAIIALRTGRLPGLSDISPAAAWISTRGEPPLLGYPDSGRLNAYVLWSLRYEWIFYLLVLPACAAGMDLIRGRCPSWLLPAGLLAATLALRLVVALPLLTYLPLFFVGMLAFECQRHPGIRSALASRGGGVAGFAALAAAVLLLPDPFGWGLPLFGLFFACVACGNAMGGVLRTRGALVLGECSYGIYLLHGVALSLLFVDAESVIARVPTGVLPLLLPLVAMIVAGVTAVTYLGIERPAIRVGRAVTQRLTGQRPRLDSPTLEIAP